MNKKGISSDEQVKLFDDLKHYGKITHDTIMTEENIRITHYSYYNVIYMVVMQDGNLKCVECLGGVLW